MTWISSSTVWNVKLNCCTQRFLLFAEIIKETIIWYETSFCSIRGLYSVQDQINFNQLLSLGIKSNPPLQSSYRAEKKKSTYITAWPSSVIEWKIDWPVCQRSAVLELLIAQMLYAGFPAAVVEKSMDHWLGINNNVQLLSASTAASPQQSPPRWHSTIILEVS